MNRAQRERKAKYRGQWEEYGDGYSYPMWLEYCLEHEESENERLRGEWLKLREKVRKYEYYARDVETGMFQVELAHQNHPVRDNDHLVFAVKFLRSILSKVVVDGQLL